MDGLRPMKCLKDSAWSIREGAVLVEPEEREPGGEVPVAVEVENLEDIRRRFDEWAESSSWYQGASER